MPRLTEPAIEAGRLNSQDQPTIAVDDELRLRPWDDRDAPTVLDVYRDSAIQRWHGGRHSVANAASCRVAEKAGFRAEGTLTSAALHADGWHDMHVHALVGEAGHHSLSNRR